MLYYPTLSLVSKSFRSLIASPELYKARSLLGHTESCLYVCIQINSERNLNWYTLYWKPEQALSKKKKSSGYLLAKVPVPNSPRAEFSRLVAVGSNIYNIGGSRTLSYSTWISSNVSILDCRSHTWREAPSLPVELCSLSAATVLDRKIYVVGQYKDGGSVKNSFEVLDTDTEIWDPEPIPCFETKGRFIDGKFHLKTNQGPLISCSQSFCQIENVVYSVCRGVIIWYDTQAEVRTWSLLMGLEGLPKLPTSYCVRLADYGGKLVVFWDEYFTSRCSRKMLWCAEIALEWRKNCEIWGKVEWFDHVLTLPLGIFFVKALAATV